MDIDINAILNKIADIQSDIERAIGEYSSPEQEGLFKPGVLSTLDRLYLLLDDAEELTYKLRMRLNTE